MLIFLHNNQRCRHSFISKTDSVLNKGELKMKRNINIIKGLGLIAIATFMFGNLSVFNMPKLYAAPAMGAQSHTAGLININQAGPEELEAISGVGPALANRIVEFRNENGPFESLDDLANVRGIGGVKLQKIKDQVTV